LTHDQALKRLIDGNARFAANKPVAAVTDDALRTDLFKNGQHPYAIIVSCSDSRVPVELVFDAGPGELFIIRTAGNVVGSIERGSIEYAVAHLKTPLVVVLGHQHCGAVKAAVDGGKHSPDIESILDAIRPSVPTKACDDPYAASEEQNVRNMLKVLSDNQTIANALSEGKLHLAGAKYSLETGIVSFFK